MATIAGAQPDRKTAGANAHARIGAYLPGRTWKVFELAYLPGSIVCVLAGWPRIQVVGNRQLHRHPGRITLVLIRTARLVGCIPCPDLDHVDALDESGGRNGERTDRRITLRAEYLSAVDEDVRTVISGDGNVCA
jgi:hypothetical protein